MFNLNSAPVEPTPALRRRAEHKATGSAVFGAMGDVTLTDSAIIILFAQMIGAGDMFSMLTTSLMPLFNGLCVILMAWLAERMGYRRLIIRSCSLSVIAYILVVFTPFFGSGSVPVVMLIGLLLIFSVLHTAYVAGWFPLLDTFLTKERRGPYLSTMRFSWQLSAATFLFLAGLFIGKEPPLWKLQVVLLCGALVFAGRIFFIAAIPEFVVQRKDSFGFADGLRRALANKPLVGFSVYLFVLNLAAYGTLPLTTIYLKKYLIAPDNVIVMISAVTLVGMLLGSLVAGRVIKRWGIKNTLLFIHITYAFVNGALFFISEGRPVTFALVTLLLLLYSVTFAMASIATTYEMLALATPGNKAMAMAFCVTFYSSGSGLSRLFSSLLLGSGILAPSWYIGSMHVCHYQSLFLLYAVAIAFAAMFLVVVPAVFPRGEYLYDVH